MGNSVSKGDKLKRAGVTTVFGVFQEPTDSDFISDFLFQVFISDFLSDFGFYWILLLFLNEGKTNGFRIFQQFEWISDFVLNSLYGFSELPDFGFS